MDKTSTKAIQTLEGHIQGQREDLFYAFECAAQKFCQSPIEKLMLARLMTVQVGYGRYRPNMVCEDGRASCPSYDPYGLVIFPQEPVGKYKADFFLTLSVPTRSGGLAFKHFVIECDGHDFHEKTKEQVAAGKKRDRVMQGQGLSVFRYSGSEIFRNDDELLRDLELAFWAFVEDVVNGYIGASDNG